MEHLAPFVDASRQKFREEIASLDLSKQDKQKLVEQRVKTEIKDGVQTMQYQINTLNTSNGQ